MEQENLEEYKVEVIEKYNEVTQKTLRNRNIFTLCTIISAIFMVVSSKYGFDSQNISELYDTSFNFMLNSGFTAIFCNNKSMDYCNFKEKVKEKVNSIDSIANYSKLQIEDNRSRSLLYNIGVIGLLGFAAFESIQSGTIISSIELLPYIAYFGTVSKQMKNVSNEYRKVLTKIKK